MGNTNISSWFGPSDSFRCIDGNLNVSSLCAGSGGSRLQTTEIHPARGAPKWSFHFAGRAFGGKCQVIGTGGSCIWGQRSEVFPLFKVVYRAPLNVINGHGEFAGCWEWQAISSDLRERDREGAPHDQKTCFLTLNVAKFWKLEVGNKEQSNGRTVPPWHHDIPIYGIHVSLDWCSCQERESLTLNSRPFSKGLQ